MPTIKRAQSSAGSTTAAAAATAAASPSTTAQELVDALAVYDRLLLRNQTYLEDYRIAHVSLHKIYHKLRRLEQLRIQSHVRNYLEKKSALNSSRDCGRTMMRASREIVIETRVQMKELNDRVRVR